MSKIKGVRLAESRVPKLDEAPQLRVRLERQCRQKYDVLEQAKQRDLEEAELAPRGQTRAHIVELP